MKIYIESAGCTRRKVEVTKFYSYFIKNNYAIVYSPKKADYILVATCAFIKKEEDQSFERVKELAAFGKKIVVYGCLPDISPKNFKDAFRNLKVFSPKNINDIDAIFPNITVKFADIKEPHQINESLERKSLRYLIKEAFSSFSFSQEFSNRTRRSIKKFLGLLNKKRTKWYYLFVSKGCLGNCTYCAIRHSVGPLRSRPIDTLCTELSSGIKAGYRNFVILGDDVGAYGKDFDKTFPDIFRAFISTAQQVSQTVTPVPSIRFYIEEIHPHWMLIYEKEILEIIKTGMISGILCPIQSGNNRILNRMNRSHDSAFIIELTKKIKAIKPDIILATQIIVGFASETENEFKDTLGVVKSSHFDIVIIFPYDEKENTPALVITPKVPLTEIYKRAKYAEKFFNKEGIAAFLNCASANEKILSSMLLNHSPKATTLR